MKTFLILLLTGMSMGMNPVAQADDKAKDSDKKEEKKDEKKESSMAGMPVCGVKNLKLSDGKVINFMSCQTTGLINQSLGLVEGVHNTANIFIQGNTNKKILDSAAQKGANLTVKDNLNSQKEMHESAAKLFIVQAGEQGASALAQGAFSVTHFAESENAKKHAKEEQINIQNYNNEIAKLAPPNEEQKKILESKIKVAQANIEILNIEAENQNQMAQKQAELAAESANRAAQTGLKANDSRMAAAQLGVESAAITGAGGGQFGFDPQGNLNLNEGGLIPNQGNDPNTLAPVDNLGPAALNGASKDFNPNSGNDSVLGANTGESGTSGTTGNSGGSGLGMGGAGGTSGARGDGEGRGEGSAPGKSQTGGMYAASGEGSGKFSRGFSSGAGVGLSAGFSDLLKKFLPGNEEKKDQRASLDLNNDRGPASDQAAVIGRNKNIFVEISKRYQKKHSEGAVVFQ